MKGNIINSNINKYILFSKILRSFVLKSLIFKYIREFTHRLGVQQKKIQKKQLNSTLYLIIYHPLYQNFNIDYQSLNDRNVINIHDQNQLLYPIYSGGNRVEPLNWNRLKNTPEQLLRHGYIDQFKIAVEKELDLPIIDSIKGSLFSKKDQQHDIKPNEIEQIKPKPLIVDIFEGIKFLMGFETKRVYVDDTPKKQEPKVKSNLEIVTHRYEFYLITAVCINNLSMVQYLIDKHGKYFDKDRFLFKLINIACLKGSREIVKYLKVFLPNSIYNNNVDFSNDNNDNNDSNDININSNNNNSNSNVCFTESCIDYAAESGNLDLVKYLLQMKTNCTTYAIDSAAAVGNLEMFTFLFESVKIAYSKYALDNAAANGHISMVEYIVRDARGSTRCTHRALDEAAENGHLKVVEILNRYSPVNCTKKAMDLASKNGHYDIVLFLHYNRTEGCTKNAYDQAAANGHFDIVQFLQENRSEGCTRAAVDNALFNNHTSIVNYILEFHPQFAPQYENNSIFNVSHHDEFN